MANLNETATWEAGIYQWETSDPVQGGPNGIDNKPTRQLANRTLWLKTEIAKAVQSIGKNKTDAENMFARKSTAVTAGAGLTGGGTLGGNVQFALGTPGTCSGNTTNWAGSDTHTHQLAAASPTVAGVAKLINNLSADDANSALSAAMGKKLNEEKLGNSGNQTLQNGYLEINRNGWEKIRFTNTDGSYWRFECAPVSHSENGARFNFVFFGSGSSEVGRVSFKSVTGNEVAAYQSWVLEQLNSAGDIVRTSGNQNVNGAKTFGEILTAGRNNHWGFLRNPVESGGHWVFETNPKSNYADGSTLKVNIKYEQTSGQVRYIHFPELGNSNHIVAYQDWVTAQINAATGAVNDKIANAVPSGAVLHFDLPTAPPGWYELNGAAVPVSACPGLVAARYVGNSANATAEEYYKCTNPSNPSGSRNVNGTHIKLPDHRGEFPRAWDHGRGVDAGRELGSWQAGTVVGADSQDAVATIGVAIESIKSNYAQTAGSLGMDTVDMSDYPNARLVWSGGRQSGLQAANPDNNGHFSGVTRPRNIALMWCIKA